MRSKVKTALGLLAASVGKYTPFLAPFWGEAEKQALDDWMEGKTFPEAPVHLIKAIKAQFGEDYTVQLANLGRSAIQTALEVMDLPPGSEVILPAFACNGVALPILQAGHRPVFADVDEDFNLRLESVQEAFSPAVKAVVLPHMSGCWAADTFRIIEWARQKGIYVVEDAAQALGLRREGRLAGTFGDVGIFSCHGGKQILGSGGAWIITRHPVLSKKLLGLSFPLEPKAEVRARVGKFVKDFSPGPGGRGRQHLIDVVQTMLLESKPPAENPPIAAHQGFKRFAISDIECHLAFLQLPKIEEMVRLRRRNASIWRGVLAPIKTKAMRLPTEPDNVCTKMLLAFPGEEGARETRAITAALGSCGVECESSYRPLYLRPGYAGFRKTIMRNTEYLWKNAFALPVRPNLGQDDWNRIHRVAREFGANLDGSGTTA